MTESDTPPAIPEDIQILLEHRSTYREWLAKLEDLSGEFRSEVAQRVATDYEERLRGVETELSTHRSGLEGSLDERRAAVDALASDHDARSAELEETELRHLVGEYSEKEYGRRKDEHASLISELEASLGRETAAVEELATVLAEIAGAAAVANLAAEIEEVMESSSPAEEAGAPAAEAELTAELARLEDGPAEPEVDEVSWGEPREKEASETVDEAVADAEGEAEADEVHLGSADEGDETMPLTIEEPSSEAPAEEGDDFLDELEFLESLSIDEPVEFDSVSRLLDEEERRSGEEEPSV